MKAKAIYIVLLTLILIVYSSEIAFMPNYNENTDHWHLFYWVLLSNIALMGVLIANVMQMLSVKKVNAQVVVILLLSFLCFALLNSSNSYFKAISFIGIVLLLVYIIFYTSFKKQSS